MRCSFRTFLVLCVVFGSSLGAFGLLGIGVTAICVLVGMSWFRSRSAQFDVVGSVFTVVLALIITIALMVPAVTDPPGSFHRVDCISNLKQLAQSLLNHHETHGSFPQAVMHDKEGRPMHSWRIVVLSSNVEYRDLYRAYNFDEPWNGPNNQKLAGDRPSVYRCRSASRNAPPNANYLAVTGPGTAWPEGRGSRLDEFTDGPANSILLVEVIDSDVPWMEPRDVTLAEALGLTAGEARVPRSHHYTQGGYFIRKLPLVGHVAFADGSVRTLYKRPSRDELAAMLTIDGGESVDLDCLCEVTLVEELRWDRVIGLPVFVISVFWFWRCLQADTHALRKKKGLNRRDAETRSDDLSEGGAC